jgi:VWFA-related protein
LYATGTPLRTWLILCWVLFTGMSGLSQAGGQRILVAAIEKKTHLKAEIDPNLLSAFGYRGHSVQIARTESAASAPIHFVLLVEVSEFTKQAKKLKPALEQSELIFREALSAHNGDVTVYAFDKSAQLLLDRTKDLTLLHDTLASLRWGKKTALLDPLSRAIQAVPQDEYRRVAIIISNGEDDSSHTKEKAVIGAARKNGVVVYALDTYFSFRRHAGRLLMERLADATGGRLLFPEDAAHVEQSFAQLRSDLSAQYWITFAQSADKWKLKYREPDVELLYPR